MVGLKTTALVQGKCDAVNTGQLTAEYKVKLKRKLRNSLTAVSWMKALCCWTHPRLLPLTLCLFRSLIYVATTLYLCVYCCRGWAYIVVNRKPEASHTDSEGCLVWQYRMPTTVTKRRYLTRWE